MVVMILCGSIICTTCGVNLFVVVTAVLKEGICTLLQIYMLLSEIGNCSYKISRTDR